MESKVTQQKEIADDIHNLYRNMKKDPIARKTLEYFDERRKTLQHLHGKFCKNDEELRGKLPADHKYIVDKFRTQVDELYQDAENYITKKIQALKNPSPTDPEPTTEAVRKQQLQIKQFEQQLRTTKERILRNNNQSFLAKRLDELTSMWKDISKTHVDIQLKDGTDIENYLRSEIYEQAYEDYLDTEEILTHNPDVAATNQSKTANLPSLQIPTFNGEYEQWPTFRDLFHQIVHKQNIADVEKMQFLKTHVRGEAGKLIQHLETSETNYNTAWSLIEERFNNQRLLFTKHVDHILNIPATNNDSSYGIKKIHDVTVESLSAIKNMNIDVDAAGPIIGHIILKKMDPESKKLYEMALEDPKQIQDLDSILAFLKKRFQSLETLKGQSKKADSDRNIKSPDTKKQWTYPSYHSQSTTCPSCSEEHRIVACKKFLAMDVNERWSLVCKKKLCRSCLTHGGNRTCKNRSRCPKCDRSHNILLHKDTAIPKNNPAPTNNEINEKNTQTIAGHVGSSNQINRQEKIAMLATAYVDVLTNDGQHKTLRSLIDPGSHKSFITESAAQLLGLPRYKHHVEITGLGVAAAGTSKWKIFTQLRPRFSSSHAHNAELLVMPKLTKNIPSININVQIPDEWNNLMFADPNFNTTAPIDILIGVDLYGEILESGLKKTTTGLILQKTTLGWIISGNAPLSVQQPEILGLIASIDIDIDEKLTKFWEIEEVQSTPNSTDDVEYSEKFYNDTHGRLPGGRYEVRLPFKNDASDLGESRRKAVARFLQLEKRFRNDKQLESDYKQFMRQYIELDHMEAVTPIGQGQPYDLHCFIPHQYVLKEGKPIRVVFDASSKTTSGLSLNDVLHTGPKLQRDLLDILLQWRVFEVALTADIEKMYRQIIISKEDRQFHRIIWRFSENEPLGEYELKTVTYGTAPAAYLAIRTLLQLAHDEYASHPLAAEIVKKNFYVDDLLISAPNQEEARLIQQETTALLKKGGFNLRKWNSNLRVLNEVNKVQDFGEKGDNSTVKALGIIWNPNTDSFQYKMHLATATATSKRKKSIPSPRTLTTMITACLTLLLISTPAKANFTIKSLNPGLYIEHLGSAYIDGGTFRLDFNISWAQIHQDEKNVNLTATRYKELCSRALEHTEDAHCNELVHHLNEMTGEILLHIGNIRDFTRNRFKRGLFGQFMTSVFGVNDEVYHQIDGLQENQQHLIDTTRHQSKLLVSAVTSMEKSEKRIMKKLEHFQYKINQGLSLMHDLHAWYRTVDKQKIMIQIVLNFQLANNYLQEVLQKYKKIAEVCYYNGHLGEFFTPDEIHHITQEANSKLPSTMSILNRPIREMKVVREKECLKIYAFLFIIDRHRFELIKATPVPQKRSNGIFTTLSIQNPYMAIEYNIQKYFEISKDDMSHEVEIGPHLYIFGPRLVRDMERHPNCITDQIYNTTSNPKCVYTTQIIEDITWSPLHDSSCLLFTTNKIKTTAIVCSGQRHPITLQNSGIVKLSHDCIIGVNGISIQTKLDASKSIQHSYELPSPLNWNELVLNDTSTSRSIHSPMFNDETNLQDLSKVGREAEEEEDGLSTYSWRKHYGHMTVLSLFSIAITAALIAIGIYIWKNWNKWRNTSHDANPHDAALDEFTLQPLRCRSAGSENKDSEYSEPVARDNV